MYKIAEEAESWLTLGMIAFFIATVGGAIEREFPGAMFIALGICVLCGAGAFLCSAYTTIYNKGWNDAKIEQEPDEDNSRDSTT